MTAMSALGSRALMMENQDMNLRMVLSAAAFAGAAAALVAAQAGTPPRIEKRAAARHPMRYFVSPPEGWTPNRDWPALVVITDAYRKFEETTGAFADARGARPFVIVTPLVLSGGGTAQQHMSDFDYDRAAWDLAEKDGTCAFDAQGLSAVLADVRQQFHTEAKVFITGWEAGGHVVLSEVLNHPERLRAAVVVTPNYQGRCVDNPPARHDSDALALPIRELAGSLDAMAARGPIAGQWTTFENLARSRGFTDLEAISVTGRGHGALASDVFEAIAPMVGR
jgi:uncharacterized membrane protein